MKDIIYKYYKVVIAQCVAFGFSWVLVNYVFLGPLPTVRAEFKESVKNVPAKTLESIKNTPAILSEVASVVFKRQNPVDPKDNEIEIIRGQIGDVWDFKPLPTHELPRVQPSPTQIVSIPTTIPTPDTGGQLPTGLPFPTNRPQATQVPRPTPRPTSVPTAIPTYKPVNLSKLEQDTIAEINKRRQEKGLPVVKANSALTDAARAHSAWMGSGSGCSKMGHIGEGGSDPGKRARDAGYRGGSIGETVACGYGTAAGVVDGWMGSPGHRAILMSAGMKEVGVGWSSNYTTAVFGG